MDDPHPTDYQSSFADEEIIVRLIELARAGGSAGIASAWQLVDELERLFSERAAGEHDCLGLAFVQALANAWNRTYDIANPPELQEAPPAYVTGQSPRIHAQQLPSALKALGLVSARGRRKANEDPLVQRKLAWARLEAAATAFSEGSRLEQWLAEFFKALLAIRDIKGLVVSGKDLLPAFDCMHLVKSHSRPSMDAGDVEALLATEELVRQVLAASRNPPHYQHGDAEAAREIAGAITNTDPARLAAVRKQHSDIARIVCPNREMACQQESIVSIQANSDHEGSWLSVAELEGMAGVDKEAIEKAIAKSVK